MATKKQYSVSGGEAIEIAPVVILPTGSPDWNGFHIELSLTRNDDPVCVINDDGETWFTEDQAEWLAKHLPIALAEYRRRKAGAK